MGQIVSTLPVLRPDFVTRVICAAMHEDDDFAVETYRELCRHSISALGPSPGIDLVAAARHAAIAYRRHRRRLILLTVSEALLLLAPLGIVAAVARGWPVLVPWAFVAFLVAVLLGWTTEVTCATRSRRSARRLVTAQVEPLKARPLSDDRERLLGEAGSSEANVVVYAARVGSEPFVGSGLRVELGRNSLPIDISRPARERGANKERRSFTISDLLVSLAERFPSTGLENVSVREVLYVRGDVAHRVPQLHADADHPPVSVVPPELLRSAARASAEGVRSYLRVHVVGPGARVVVSLHVRPKIIGRQLTYDVVAHVLPPLAARYLGVLAVPANPLIRTVQPFLTGPRALLARMYRAPRDLWREGVHACSDAYRLAQARRNIRQGYAVDVGTETTLRWRTSDRGESADFDEADVVDWLRRMTRALVDATEQFLDDHNISTADLRRHRDSLVNNYYTIERVDRSHVGSGGTVANTGSNPEETS